MPTPMYANPNRERSGAHKMAAGHARNGAKVWVRHDMLVNYLHLNLGGFSIHIDTRILA